MIFVHKNTLPMLLMADRGTRMGTARGMLLEYGSVRAARGVLGHEKGIVAIMGTGSNAFFWDGNEVSRNVYSGGFYLNFLLEVAE